MTTRVVIECPAESHWKLNVTIEDQVFDHTAGKMTDEYRTADTFTLAPTEKRETYLTSSRRMRVEEGDPVAG